jgi:hypothetical protein
LIGELMENATFCCLFEITLSTLRGFCQLKMMGLSFKQL